LLAAETTIPAVVWIVTIAGGALTIAFALLSAFQASVCISRSAALAIFGALVLS